MGEVSANVDTAPDTSSTPRRRLPFVARIVLGMVLGVAFGFLARGLGWSQVARIGEIGSVIIDLIKALAGPLLFLAVVDAFLRTKVAARSAGLMVAIALTNALIAVSVGLALSNLLQPGHYLRATPPTAPGGSSVSASTKIQKLDFLRELTGYLPRNVLQPFLDNSVITIVVLAVLSGWALRRVKTEQQAAGETGYRVIESAVEVLFRATELVLGLVISLVPLAVFAVVTRTVAAGEFDKFVGLAAYIGVALLGLSIQVFVVYQAWIVLGARMRLREFWSGARDAVIYALGSSSSLATLPVTLRCLDRMKVSPQAARLASCVGTNLNNDGILLYEAMAVMFVAQVYGIHLSLGQQLVAAASCVVAGIGIAAVPDAGLISLALVLETVGLPTAIVPLLLTVDWLLSRCRAATNVSSDVLVAVLLDRFGVGREEPMAEPELPEWEIDLAQSVETSEWSRPREWTRHGTTRVGTPGGEREVGSGNDPGGI